jgi:circadian clock protein KaiB
MARFEFRIYVVGGTTRARRAVANLRGVCEAHAGDDFAIEVIDVLSQPDRAEEERILATPTVIKLAPLPRRRVVGDLSEADLAAIALDLTDPEGSVKKGLER